MKKKNKQKFASEEEPRQPQGPAQDSNFSLEEILREFGGGENAPAQNPPEAIPQSVQLDIHCRSGTFPLALLKRQMRLRQPPLPPPGRSKPLLRSLPPRKSHAQRAVLPLATQAVRFPNSG